MARISFDNGNSYLDPTDYRDEIMEELEGHDWDAIVAFMYDDTREETHSAFEYDDGDNLGFLLAYLNRAKCDLVIG